MANPADGLTSSLTVNSLAVGARVSFSQASEVSWMNLTEYTSPSSCCPSTYSSDAHNTSSVVQVPDAPAIGMLLSGIVWTCACDLFTNVPTPARD